MNEVRHGMLGQQSETDQAATAINEMTATVHHIAQHAGATRGEVLYTLQSVSGTTLSVNMPCDCRILPTRAGEGSTVMAGSST